MENGVVKVVSPIDDTPASKAGLLANDLITHIDNEQIVGLTLEQAVDKMRGPVNTPITLTIVRKGVDDPFDVKVMRDIIRINPVKAHNEGDVAYIKVTAFNEQTHANLVKAIDEAKKTIGSNLKGYIIDLRNNPGGLLDQAIAVSDDFLEDGAIVITKGRNEEETQRANAHPGDEPMAKRSSYSSTADRPQPPRLLPAHCMTKSAQPSSARAHSAKARLRRSCRSAATVRSD